MPTTPAEFDRPATALALHRGHAWLDVFRLPVRLDRPPGRDPCSDFLRSIGRSRQARPRPRPGSRGAHGAALPATLLDAGVLVHTTGLGAAGRWGLWVSTRSKDIWWPWSGPSALPAAAHRGSAAAAIARALQTPSSAPERPGSPCAASSITCSLPWPWTLGGDWAADLLRVALPRSASARAAARRAVPGELAVVLQRVAARHVPRLHAPS